MVKSLIESSCSDFAAVLASKASVPGGGGAAALTGALGVALCSMVGNFTVGKKKYAAYEEDVKAILEKGEMLRCQLLELVEADAKAFVPLAEAYAIPKDDPRRDDVLEQATVNACKAPVEIVHRCADGIELLEKMLEKGSVMLISDVGCGALLCKAAMESAAMNVFINTKGMRNRSYAAATEDEINVILNIYGEKANHIIKCVNDKLKGEG